MAVGSLPRNPYTVGGPVRGPHFYGRGALIQVILDGNDRAIWVVGNRRIGKTSLLRRLEDLGTVDGRVAFLISMEAADTVADLAQCFLDDIETGDDRLARLGLAIGDLQGKTPSAIMRLLDRRGRERGVEVLLLLDEAEALIGIAEREGDDILKDLRREMQRSEALRVVMTATKRLAALNDLCRGWDTSPFLYGVKPRYLGRLEHEEALALIRQSQSPTPPLIADGIADAVLAATDGHPFLTQWLCDRLWSDGVLRPLVADDLIPDSNLVNLFQLDYNYLAPVERRILRCLSFVESLDDAGLMGQLGVTMADMQLRYLIQSLVQLCYVRRAADRYSTGNRLLHIWLQFWATDAPESPMSDAAAVDQADEEQQRIMALATTHKRRLRVLEEQRALRGVDTPAEIVLEIEDITKQIADLDARLAVLRSHA
ncbi:MAG TPA: AAA family ATPase [Roseiflexaceae bacterium]|nr:AAA family ATPase [Roseiflexaceae bacterium]